MNIAKGEIWLFLDDDVLLEPTFVEELLAAYSPGVMGVSGIITNYQKPSLGRRLWETVFVRGVFRDDRQPVYWDAEKLRNGPPIRVRQLGAGLMSFRASAIRALRFDPNLTGTSLAEDIDFCARLPKGSVLLIAPNARLVHKRSPQGRKAGHWLALHAQVSNYLRQRHWRAGLRDNLCLAWLNVGYAVAAALASGKRRSLEPWRAWRQGVRKGIELARKKAEAD